jgi:hypothetical protein
LGIIAFPKGTSEYWFVGGEAFRYIVLFVYIIIGGLIFLYFLLEQRRKRDV